MKSLYYNTPDKAIAVNFKVGSATIARAVIRDHQLDTESLLTTPHGGGSGTAYPEGKSADDMRWHGFVDKCEAFDKPTTLLLVRDPLEKFRSACAEDGITDVDAHLDWLEANPHSGQRVHFWPQSRLLQGNTVKLYKFPEQIDDLATEAGLTLPLPNIAGSNPPKPTLTAEQTVRVEALYAGDITLYNSITEAGMLTAPTANPVVEVVIPSSISPRQLRLALSESGDRDAVEALVASQGQDVQDSYEFAESFQQSDPILQAMAAILEWDQAKVDSIFILAGTKPK